jgi:hypothetical protein
MEMEILGWEPESDFGEAGGVVVRGRLFEALVTATTAGVEADVIDGGKVLWQGILPSVAAAKAEALARARRASFRVV